MATTALLIGLASDSGVELRARLGRVGVSTRAFRHAADIGFSVSDGGAYFAMVPFFSAVEFGAELSELAVIGLDRAVVAVLPKGTYAMAADAFRAGAHDVIARPFDQEDLGRLVIGVQGASRTGFDPTDILPLAEVERQCISQALAACKGQVSMTARRLGIGRSTLYRKLELYRLAGFGEDEAPRKQA